MNNIKLVALDMDGTLLNDDQEVTSYTKKVIQQALNKNVHIVLATGRALPLCHSYAKDLQLSSYLIAANGAEIWTVDGKLLQRNLFDSETVEQLWQVGNDLDLHMWTIATDEVFHKSSRPERFHDYDWLKIGYGRLDEAMKNTLLKRIEHIENIQITNSSTTNIEVNSVGVDKATALQYVCEQIGITMDNIMAVGDSLNDLTMIEQAKIGIAMGNAQQNIKDKADYITDTNNLDGVAKAIEKFVLS